MNLEFLIVVLMLGFVPASLAIIAMSAWRKRIGFGEKWPPTPNDEFIGRCSPGTSREVAIRVLRAVSNHLGVDYGRVSPRARFGARPSLRLMTPRQIRETYCLSLLVLCFVGCADSSSSSRATQSVGNASQSAPNPKVEKVTGTPLSDSIRNRVRDVISRQFAVAASEVHFSVSSSRKSLRRRTRRGRTHHRS